MAMAMDEQPSHPYRRWGLPLESGTGHRLTPRANEPIYVTDVFLVDAKSAGGHGAVAACVEIGTRDLLLGLVSAENPHVELQTPVMLDEEFRFYVMGPGDDANADAGTGTDTEDDADADVAVVMFEGFLVTNTEEDAADDKDEEYEEREETYGELDRYVARASSAGGISKDARQVVAIAIAFLGILVSVSMLAFLGLIK
ncbi:hypothetical protein CFC21_110824 [Triticum aestivum]|uniref:Nucleoplasmin-like domain-containing protein n=2 Tax=Triticum aestivum TaxID=4565 RepID=A0A3B6TJX7_WHEAT|nr:hypothetical protein CFC21_110824 [Triticum aestivum]